LFLTLGKVIIILSVMFPPSAVSAAGIAAVQSVNIKPYNNALAGFKSVCDCKVKSFIVSEMQESDIAEKVKKAKPDVIIAIGIDAFERVRMIKDIPIVYLMVLNPRTMPSKDNNITGVSMNIAPEKQLKLLKQALPGIKRIGLLYDPAWTGNFVKKAKLAAPATGIKIIAREIRNSKDYPSLLESMEGEVNAFWMLPDLTAVTPETVEFLFLCSMKSGVPVITFSDKYLSMGALMSFDIDAYDIGKQAGEMVKEILSGTGINNIARTDARKINLTINRRIAKKQGIKISDEILDKAGVVNGK
ncbi:MAG TPA: ABC transporter substrate-binding protein, partial [Nitrospirae bacterium]|nr:ABC transporter substrate-binding protein [Nitrospirota bacterium]